MICGEEPARKETSEGVNGVGLRAVGRCVHLGAMTGDEDGHLPNAGSRRVEDLSLLFLIVGEAGPQLGGRVPSGTQRNDHIAERIASKGPPQNNQGDSGGPQRPWLRSRSPKWGKAIQASCGLAR